MKDTCPWWRDAIFSQAVSQSVNNIYWVPNERRCPETARRRGLWPWGAARTMTESEQRDKARKAIEAAPQQERPGGCTTHLCGAPPARGAIYAKGLFITELLGPSSNAAKDVSYLLRASVSPAAKGAQNWGPRREPSKASACAARSTARARRGQKAPEAPRRSRGKGRAPTAGCGGTSPLSRPVIRRSVWNEGRALKLLF